MLVESRTADGVAESFAKLQTKSHAAAIGMDMLRGALESLAFTAIIAVISEIVNTIITEFTEVVNAYEDGIKKLKDLSDEVKSLESEQESLNDELRTSQKRLNDLQNLEMPTLFQKEEIENLKEYNKGLELQIRLNEYALKQKKQEANLAAQKQYKNSQLDWFHFNDPFTEDYTIVEHLINAATWSFFPGGLYSAGKNIFQNAVNWIQGNTWEQQTAYIKEAEEAINNFNNTINKSDYVQSTKSLLEGKVNEIKQIRDVLPYLTGEDAVKSVFGDIDVQKTFGKTADEVKSPLL